MSSLWWIFASFVYALCILTLSWQRKQRQQPFVQGFVWMVFLFVFQTIALLLKGFELGSCPVRGEANVLFYFSWSLTLFYISLGKSYRASILGLFSLPAICLLSILSMCLEMFGAHTAIQDQLMVTIHVAIAMLGYAALILSGLVGCVFLRENKRLKQHLLPGKESGLPPVRILHTTMKRLMFVSFLLLLVSEIFGFVAHMPITHGKVVVVSLLNVSFLIVWGIQWYRGLSAKKWALVSIALSLFSMTLFFVTK